MATALQELPHVHAPTPEALLANSPLPEIRRVFVTATDEFVTLTGTVSTYYLKQIAQETVRSGVRDRKLFNRLVVADGR